MDNIKTFAACNGFPKRIAYAITKKAAEYKPSQVPTVLEETIDIFITLTYLGNKGDSIMKSTKRKLFRCGKDKNIKLAVQYQTTKVFFFTSTNDRKPLLSNSGVVYKMTCSGCAETYVGKTECTLYKRTAEHEWESKDSVINQHLNNCENYHHIRDLHAINEILVLKEFHMNTVRDNVCILAKTNNWQTLLILEALHIKEHRPQLNTGLKATKQLQLF